MVKKLLLSSFLILLGFLIYCGVVLLKFHDTKLHIIFCNVGQGDGILIKTPEKITALVDSGPNDSIKNCLSSYLPLWGRTINLAFLTHPHLDHFQGYISLLDSYTIDQFATEQLSNKSPSYQVLEKDIEEHAIPRKFIFAGDRYTTPDGVIFRMLSPTREALHMKSPEGYITDSKEFTALIIQITYGSFSALLTGDSQNPEVKSAISIGKIQHVDLLQVPHHGSATGLDLPILQALRPTLAVISVGKNNYGLPNVKTLSILKDTNTKTFRTDQVGNIEIVTDGKTWDVR